MVDSEAFHGKANRNALYFPHNNVRSVKLVAAGQNFPENGYHMKMSEGKCLQAYQGLFKALNMDHDDRGNGISRYDYLNGYTFFGFDLTPDQDCGDHWELVKEGTLSLHMEFETPIAQPGGIEVLLYMEYDNLLTIDKNRVPSTDYTA